MRKVKSTALLGAFVAVASLGIISHEAHGTTLTSTSNTIAKEALPASVTLPAPVLTASVNYTSSATLTLTLNGGAAFLGSYTIGNGAGCAATASVPSGTLYFTGCSITASASYPIENVSDTTFSVTAPSQGISLISLSYTSTVNNDTTSSVTLAQVQQQLTVKPAELGTVYIDPTSLSTFIQYPPPNYVGPYPPYGAYSNYAYNSMTISSSIGFYLSITSDTLNVALNGIPSSVSSITTTFLNPTANSDTASVNYTTQTGSATVSLTLPNSGSVFNSTGVHSDIATFYFYNSGNIQPGTIYISSILGSAGLYLYFSGSQNFLTFAPGGTQIYVPDALAPDNNAIQSGYITISMPTSTSIASISVLNTSASCPVPTLANGALQSTSTTGVYYIDLSKLAPLCTGLSASAWQSGVPLVIYISGTNVNATPNNITADAYATFNGMLKRIPVNVLNVSNVSPYTNFSY
jgi:hypothetical protein